MPRRKEALSGPQHQARFDFNLALLAMTLLVTTVFRSMRNFEPSRRISQFLPNFAEFGTGR